MVTFFVFRSGESCSERSTFLFIIGSRTIKTAIGAMFALVIAQLLSLDNASTAAVIALLSVQSTKMESIMVAFRRFCACLSGILLAILIFEGTAYTPLAIGLILIIYITLMAKLSLQDGIVPGFVIIMQFYVHKEVTVDFILNEIAIFSIGIIMALLLNLYMPSNEKHLKALTKETEENMRSLLIQLSRYIYKKENVWHDAFAIKTVECIKKGSEVAKKTVENTFFRKEDYYMEYFKMRDQQIRIIQSVLPKILHLPTTFEQSEMVANFIENVGVRLTEDYPATDLLDDFHELKLTFANMDLPKTREEFETRAALLVFMNEIERFLQLKINFYEEVIVKKNRV